MANLMRISLVRSTRKHVPRHGPDQATQDYYKDDDVDIDDTRQNQPSHQPKEQCGQHDHKWHVGLRAAGL